MKVFGPYTKENGRKIVIVVQRNGKRRTVSYPKWLLEQHLGRKLKIDETVDHWDSNKDNNDISNLRILPRAEHSAEDTRRVVLIKLKCDWCNKDFERSPRIIRDKAKKNVSGCFCSRSCAGKYSRMVQLKIINKLAPIKPVESEYYKRKYALEEGPFEYLEELSIEDIIAYAKEEE
jgi:hypothetical protein